jgi:hypothetical protein
MNGYEKKMTSSAQRLLEYFNHQPYAIFLSVRTCNCKTGYEHQMVSSIRNYHGLGITASRCSSEQFTMLMDE